MDDLRLLYYTEVNETCVVEVKQLGLTKMGTIFSIPSWDTYRLELRGSILLLFSLTTNSNSITQLVSTLDSNQSSMKITQSKSFYTGTTASVGTIRRTLSSTNQIKLNHANDEQQQQQPGVLKLVPSIAAAASSSTSELLSENSEILHHNIPQIASSSTSTFYYKSRRKTQNVSEPRPTHPATRRSHSATSSPLHLALNSTTSFTQPHEHQQHQQQQQQQQQEHTIKSPVAFTGTKSSTISSGLRARVSGAKHGAALVDEQQWNTASSGATALHETVGFQDDLVGIFSVLGCIIKRKKGTELKLRKGSESGPVLIRFGSVKECDYWENVVHKLSNQEVRNLSDFEIVGGIGKGASGNVFLVSEKSHKFALKVIKKSARGDELKHVVDERLNLSKIIEKPFLVQMKYTFQSRSAFYFIMKFYEGGDLFQYLSKTSLNSDSRKISVDCIRLLSAQVVLALESLHLESIVYRDLKPENILIDAKDGSIVLADFGLSKRLEWCEGNVTRSICGTMSFAAPEMLSADEEAYGKSVDFWSLGILLYYLMEGELPFSEEYLGEICGSRKSTRRVLSPVKKLEFRRTRELECTEFEELIGGLLEMEVDKRLGCGADGVNEVKRHGFYRGIDWARLEKNEIVNQDLYEYVNSHGGATSGEKAEQPGVKLDMMRHFDRDVTASIQMEHEEEEFAYGDIALWPPFKAKDKLLEDSMLVGFEYTT